MGALHQQLSQIRVAGFADAQLRIASARLPLLGLEPEIGSNVPAMGKTLGLRKREDGGE